MDSESVVTVSAVKELVDLESVVMVSEDLE